MADLNALYQEKILGYARQARQSIPLGHPDASATMVNPSCGDEVSVALTLEHDRITAISAQAKGCAICEASTGFALKSLMDKTTTEALLLPESIKAFLMDQGGMPLDDGEAFESIKSFKSRHSCVLLVYEAVSKAISKKE